MALETAGQYRIGDRIWVEGQPHRVTRVLDQTYWSGDRIDDEDEFGREVGWWSTVETEPDQLTPEEADRAAREQTRKQAAREQARREQETYERDLAAVTAAVEALVTGHGLVPAPQGVTGLLHGTTEERLGYASRPGRGVSHDTEGAVYRDGSGAVAGVSLGCPVDYGPRYWVTPARAAAGADRRRVWSWWNPSGYGADTYPGPGVGLDDLTPEERAEVDRLEAARLEAIRLKVIRGLEVDARWRLEEEGLVAPEPGIRTRPPKSRPVLALAWRLEYGDGFESSILETAEAYRRQSDRPQLHGLTLRVTLPAAAWAKPSPRSKKPAPVESLPVTLRLDNFATAAVLYERGD